MRIGIHALFLGMALASCSDSTSTTRALKVIQVRPLGAIGAVKSIGARDGGPSCIAGGKIVWTFGDTLFSPKSVDNTNLRSNTAALADIATPTNVSEPTDANGAPLPFVPFSAEEQAYNDLKNAGDDRYALWVSTLVPTLEGGCDMFVTRLLIGPGFLNYTGKGTALATIRGASTTAERVGNILFEEKDPPVLAAMIDGGFAYLYFGGPEKGRGIARVPREKLRDRGSYTFFDGSSWQPEISKMKLDTSLFYFTSSLSVSYNAYVGGYLAVASKGFSNEIVAFTSAKPGGPWSSGTTIYTSPPPLEGDNNYAGMEHPHLSKNGGKTLVLSYSRATGYFKGGVELVEVDLE